MDKGVMNGRNLRRRVTDFFAGPFQHQESAAGAFLRLTDRFRRAQVFIQAIYALAFFQSIQLLRNWPAQAGRDHPVLLWPVSWLSLVSYAEGVYFILFVHLFGPLLALILPGSRTARFLSFLGVLMWTAFNNSFGKIGHDLHLLIFLMGLFIFLPEGWNRKEGRRNARLRTVHLLWAGQALVMLSYTMAGIIKVVAGVYQFSAGEVSMFHPQALAWHTAQRLWQTNSDSLLGPWLIEHAWIGWPLMLGAVYLELTAWWVMFRPQWQPWWAAGLILFHLGSYFLMTILFAENCFLLAFFFLQPVFLNRPVDWSRDWRTLPLLDLFLRKRSLRKVGD
jgi:hypothetical protein